MRNLRNLRTRREARLRIAHANYSLWDCLQFWAYQMRRLGADYPMDDASDLWVKYPTHLRPTPAWKARFRAVWDSKHPFAVEEQFGLRSQICMELYNKGK
jgi:hypothetical protein